eukprot:scaffold3374_cov141-Cylindrotheca_fusiformis.AAC.2
MSEPRRFAMTILYIPASANTSGLYEDLVCDFSDKKRFTWGVHGGRSRGETKSFPPEGCLGGPKLFPKRLEEQVFVIFWRRQLVDIRKKKSHLPSCRKSLFGGKVDTDSQRCSSRPKVDALAVVSSLAFHQI